MAWRNGLAGRVWPVVIASGFSLVAAPAAPASPKAAATPDGTRRVEHRSTAWYGTQDGKPGYWFTFTNITYEWQQYFNVVAVYRRLTTRWVQDLKGHRIESQASDQEAAVRRAVEKTGYDNLAAYVDKNAAKKTGYEVSSTAVVLIDKDTGDIVGTVPVTDADNARSFLAANDGKGLKIKLASGQTEDVRIMGYVWHASPVILDLEGLGRPDLLAGTEWGLVPGRKMATAGLRQFDLDGSGHAIWEWVGPRSGLLVWDPAGVGQIRSGKQLFGNYTWGKRWHDGYEALATLDRNGDHRLTGSELASLRLWIDIDSDGVCRPSEVFDLAALGIEEIGLDATRGSGGAWNAAGFKRREADGKVRTLATWDWIALGKPRPTDGTYVWVGKEDGQDFGGYLRLSDDGGSIRGLSYPTVGGATDAAGHIVALPIIGEVAGGTVTWHTPAPDGEIVSSVTWEGGGKHLYGLTQVNTRTRKSRYTWQAELIAGKPIGGAAHAPRH